MKGVLLGLILSIGLVALPAAAKTYSWIDKDGNRQFSQTPPPGQATEGNKESEDAAPEEEDDSYESQYNKRSAEYQRKYEESRKKAQASAARRAQSSWADNSKRERENCDRARKQLRDASASGTDDYNVKYARQNVEYACK